MCAVYNWMDNWTRVSKKRGERLDGQRSRFSFSLEHKATFLCTNQTTKQTTTVHVHVVLLVWLVKRKVLLTSLIISLPNFRCSYYYSLSLLSNVSNHNVMHPYHPHLTRNAYIFMYTCMT